MALSYNYSPTKSLYGAVARRHFLTEPATPTFPAIAPVSDVLDVALNSMITATGAKKTRKPEIIKNRTKVGLTETDEELMDYIVQEYGATRWDLDLEKDIQYYERAPRGFAKASAVRSGTDGEFGMLRLASTEKFGSFIKDTTGWTPRKFIGETKNRYKNDDWDGMPLATPRIGNGGEYLIGWGMLDDDVIAKRERFHEDIKRASKTTIRRWSFEQAFKMNGKSKEYLFDASGKPIGEWVNHTFTPPQYWKATATNIYQQDCEDCWTDEEVWARLKAKVNDDGKQLRYNIYGELIDWDTEDDAVRDINDYNANKKTTTIKPKSHTIKRKSRKTIEIEVGETYYHWEGLGFNEKDWGQKKVMGLAFDFEEGTIQESDLASPYYYYNEEGNYYTLKGQSLKFDIESAEMFEVEDDE